MKKELVEKVIADDIAFSTRPGAKLSREQAGVNAHPADFSQRGAGRCSPRDCQRITPRRRRHAPPGGPTPGVSTGEWGARNIDGVRIQDTSKRLLSASRQQCGVVEGASVSWNFDYTPGEFERLS